MRSFAIAIEPVPDPRLAACALLLHLAAAATPWLARCQPYPALALSLLALGGLVATLSRVPGAHAGLRAVALDAGGLRARLAQRTHFGPAAFARGTRAYAALVVLDLTVDGRRRGWLLTRATLPRDDFRRLKARIRLTC